MAATWTISGTTATYAEGENVYATISGLSSKLTAETVAAALEVGDTTITVHKAAVEDLSKSAKITLTNGEDKNYALKLGTDVNADTYEWSFSGTTATYKQIQPVQFAESSATEIKGSAAAKNTTLATISKLNAGIDDIDSVVSISEGIITLKPAALGTANVKLTNKNSSTFKLALDSGYMTGNEENPKVWSVSGTTAKFYDTAADFSTKPGYALQSDNINVKYTAPKFAKGAEAKITVSGVKSGIVPDGTGAIDGIRVSGTTVYVAADLLNKKNITVSDGYTLAFEPADLETADDLYTTDTEKITATHSGSNLKLQQELSAGYTLSANGKAILYSATAGKKVEIAKITNVNEEGYEFDHANGTITLSAAALKGKAVKISGDADYTILLDEDVDKAEPKGEAEWTLKKSTATYGLITTAGYAVAEDGKSVSYSAKEKTETYATLSGINSSLTAETVDDAIEVDGKTITLHALALATSTITLKSDDYTLALGDDVIKEKASEAVEMWNVSGTTATLQDTIPAYYELDGTKVKYNKATTSGTPKIKLTGLASGLTVIDGEISGIDVEGSVITLSDNVLNKKAVKIAKGDDYTLALDGEVDISESSFAWTSASSKITLNQTKSAGYSVDDGAKSVSYLSKEKSSSVATVTGLNSPTVTEGDIEGITIDGENKKLTITAADLLGDSKITATGYTLALDSEIAAEFEAEWVVNTSKKTAVYRLTLAEDGYVVASDGKSISKLEKGATVDLYTLSGLKTGVTAEDFADVTVEDGIITLTTDILGTTKVSVKGNATLALDGDVPQEGTAITGWVVNKTSAVYQQNETAHYKLDTAKNVVNYVAASAKGDAILTVSGLKSGLVTDSEGKIDGVDLTNTTITLSAAALGTTNVTLTSDEDDYKLALGGDVTESVAGAPEWELSKTTAKYTQTIPAGFTLDSGEKSITYTKKDTVATMATISGLVSGVTEDDIAGISIGGDKITLPSSVLAKTVDEVTTFAKTVKLTNGKDLSGDKSAYTLVSGYTPTTGDMWYVKNTTAQYVNCVGDHFEASKDGTKLTYAATEPAEGAVAVITLDGIKKNAVVDGHVTRNSTKSTLTLIDDTLFNKKAITIGGSGGYTLLFGTGLTDEAGYHAAGTTEQTWSAIKSNKITLNQQQKTGYTIANDGKSISYLSADKAVAVATVSGVTEAPAALDSDSTTIVLAGEKLKSAVTVDGTGYTFNFAADFNDGTITGSKNVDNIVTSGTGLTINTGKGDDVIDLGKTARTDKGDTLVYASGDGNDVIANFTADDTIKVNLAKTAFTASAAVDSGNVVVTVTKGKTVGTITLSGVTDTANVHVVDKSGNDVLPAASGNANAVNDLLYSDNYALGSELGEIIGGNDINTFSVGEIETDNATALAKDTIIVAAAK